MPGWTALAGWAHRAGRTDLDGRAAAGLSGPHRRSRNGPRRRSRDDPRRCNQEGQRSRSRGDPHPHNRGDPRPHSQDDPRPHSRNDPRPRSPDRAGAGVACPAASRSRRHGGNPSQCADYGSRAAAGRRTGHPGSTARSAPVAPAHPTDGGTTAPRRDSSRGDPGHGDTGHGDTGRDPARPSDRDRDLAPGPASRQPGHQADVIPRNLGATLPHLPLSGNPLLPAVRRAVS
jgi:hypothetical protein